MRDTAAVSRQLDTTQAYQAVQAKAAADHQQKSVGKTAETNKAQINSDNEGGQAQQYQNMRRIKKSEKTPDVDLNIDVALPDPYGASIIDVSV